MSTLLYLMCFILFIIGLYCVLIKRNLIKIAMGITIIEYAINLLIVMSGYRWGAHAPVLNRGVKGFTYVDPLVQAMAILSILIGLVLLIVFSALAIKLYEKYRTFDITEIRKLRG